MKRLVLSPWAMMREMKGMSIRGVKNIFTILRQTHIRISDKIKLSNLKVMNQMINLQMSIIVIVMYILHGLYFCSGH